MGNLPYVQSFRDLLAYQKARQLAQVIFKLTTTFPREEIFSLTDQIRRSSRSIGAQIAEAWAKRRYEKHFLSKLTDADGEQQETQHWIDIAADCSYLSPKQVVGLMNTCEEIGRLLGGMMAKSSLFCGEPPNRLYESTAEYFVSDQESVIRSQESVISKQ
jgi:four helix bundle protein